MEDKTGSYPVALLNEPPVKDPSVMCNSWSGLDITSHDFAIHIQKINLATSI